VQNPQSLHKYLYVHGDPVQGVDPTGLSLLSTSISVGLISAGLTLGYNLAKGAAYGFVGEYSPANIAKKTGLAFAFGFTIAYAIGWWTAYVIAAGESIALTTSLVAFMTLPTIGAASIANLTNAYDNGDEIDQYFAKLDILLLLAGGAKLGRQKILEIRASRRIRVYRVEGTPNTRVHIDENGTVLILEPNKTLYLTFGDRARAEQYLQQKLGPGQKLGPLPQGRIKSFEVSQSFVDDLKAHAVYEADLAINPSLKDRPLIADPNQTCESFGLRPAHIQQLEAEIIQGTGIDEL